MPSFARNFFGPGPLEYAILKGGDAISYTAPSTDGVQVVPCVIRKKSRFAPKILKKKSTLNKISSEPNLKHVTFEVEQLLAREGNIQDRNVARDRLVVSFSL
ncbi:hypothetical protein ANCCAN_06178 [Ancylostoma caninum]|uniref:Uncharacterized protein n=1 Tax=Ancylostoma caninum TaxID=29170 RepID=A0A368GTS2_ANCCA|nr:hypothetical protein ANCCAN_06178 [Ancylostoma caninum]